MSASRAGGPPRLPEWLLTRCLRPDDRTMILGDLREQFDARARSAGATRAALWYWREAARLAWGLRSRAAHSAQPRSTVLAWDDVRYAARRLRKQPLASIASVATLACAIGAAAATWSLLSAVLLNPLHLPDAERLMQIDHVRNSSRGPQTIPGFTYPAYVALREAAPMPVAAWGRIGSPTPLMIQGSGEARAARIIFASHDLLQVLGLRTSLGRFFADDEDQRGAALVAVLSDRFWRAEFHADPGVIGRILQVGDHPVEIVGVAPRGFHGFEVGGAPDLLMPLRAIDQIAAYPDLYSDHPVVYWVQPVGRLPDGVTRAQMETRLNGLAIDPANSHRSTFALTSVDAAAIDTTSRTTVMQFNRLLGATVVMLMAIGSITVGMLLVLRTEARSGELAMCLALGASRMRLAAGVAVEGVLLAAAGAAGALPVSQILFAGLRAFELPGGIRVDRLDLSLDGRVLAGAAVAAIASVLVMAVVAALFGVRRNLDDVVRSHAGATPRLTRRRSRSALVTAQVAVTLVLGTGAGLFAHSIVRALSLDPGIDIRRLIHTSVNPAAYGYDAARESAFFIDLGARLAADPAVASVARSANPFGTNRVMIDGQWRELPVGVGYSLVDDSYFRTIGVPVSAGRAFTATDRAGAPPVAIVSASLAKLIAGGGSPIGHRIGGAAVFGGKNPENDLTATAAEIVGVVPDVVWGVGGPHGGGQLYQPLAQHTIPVYAGSGGTALSIRAAGDAPAAMRAVSAAVQTLDPRIHLERMATVESTFLDAMAPQRFGMTVMGALGAIALLLSVLGAYVAAESMATLRRREMGIRAALGAPGSHLRMLLLSETLRLIGAGLLLGFALAWLGAGTIRAFLFQVEPFDPLVTGGVAALIIGLTLVVSLRPALAAARVDLARVLHED